MSRSIVASLSAVGIDGFAIPLSTAKESILDLIAVQARMGNKFDHCWVHYRMPTADGRSLSFPWYNTRHDMEYIVTQALLLDDGGEYSDVEQGWEMVCKRVGTQLHLAQYDDVQGGNLLGELTIEREKFANDWLVVCAEGEWVKKLMIKAGHPSLWLM